MKPLSALFRLTCLLLVVLLASCSSIRPAKDKDKSHNTRKKSSSDTRLAERLGKWDTTKRSSFDAHRSAGGVNKDYKTGLFHRKKDSSFKKEFNTGKGDFKTKEFAQSDKKSNAGNKTFSGADDKNRMGDQTFKTSESRFGSQENRNQQKRSSMEDDVFRTREDPIARDAMKSNKRPYIDDTQNPGYTEDQVKGILGK